MSEIRSTGEHYSGVELRKEPAIYTKAKLYDAMFAAGDFRPFRVLDAMCGEGLVGKEISKRAADRALPHKMHYCDVAHGKLVKLRQEGNEVVEADTRVLPYVDGSFDRVYTRFGVKNYPPDEQRRILTEFRRILRAPGGILVLTDMESPEDAYEFMQQERREKHSYTRLEGSEPHIPTRAMWLDMLRECGLTPREIRENTSYVTTTDWVKSNQMTAENLEKMNAFLLAAPETARRALNIRQEGQLVKIDYLVVVISAVTA